MQTHLQRASEVRRLYRKGLELSRLFPDPCGRNYLMRRVQEVFRNRATETSPTKIGQHIKEGRQNIRRMERGLHNKTDYERVVQLSYGVVGRMRHVLHSALGEVNDDDSKKVSGENRPPKFSLPPLPGEARETFTLGLLMRKIELLHGGDVTPDSVGAMTSGVTTSELPESDLHAVKTQLATLRESVPTFWARRRGTRRDTSLELGSDDDDNDSGTDLQPVSPTHKKRWRQDWLPDTWDVCRENIHKIISSDSRKLTNWAGLGSHGGPHDDWELTHAALLLTTFKPGIESAVKGVTGVVETDTGSAGETKASPFETETPKLKRSWRRFYGSALSMSTGETLVVENVPQEWRGGCARAVDNANDATSAATHLPIVLTHRGQLVDAFHATRFTRRVDCSSSRIYLSMDSFI